MSSTEEEEAASTSEESEKEESSEGESSDVSGSSDESDDTDEEDENDPSDDMSEKSSNPKVKINPIIEMEKENLDKKNIEEDMFILERIGFAMDRIRNRIQYKYVDQPEWLTAWEKQARIQQQLNASKRKGSNSSDPSTPRETSQMDKSGMSILQDAVSRTPSIQQQVKSENFPPENSDTKSFQGDLSESSKSSSSDESIEKKEQLLPVEDLRDALHRERSEMPYPNDIKRQVEGEESNSPSTSISVGSDEKAKPTFPFQELQTALREERNCDNSEHEEKNATSQENATEESLPNLLASALSPNGNGLVTAADEKNEQFEKLVRPTSDDGEVQKIQPRRQNSLNPSQRDIESAETGSQKRVSGSINSSSDDVWKYFENAAEPAQVDSEERQEIREKDDDRIADCADQRDLENVQDNTLHAVSKGRSSTEGLSPKTREAIFPEILKSSFRQQARSEDNESNSSDSIFQEDGHAENKLAQETISKKPSITEMLNPVQMSQPPDSISGDSDTMLIDSQDISPVVNFRGSLTDILAERHVAEAPDSIGSDNEEAVKRSITTTAAVLENDSDSIDEAMQDTEQVEGPVKMDAIPREKDVSKPQFASKVKLFNESTYQSEEARQSLINDAVDILLK